MNQPTSQPTPFSPAGKSAPKPNREPDWYCLGDLVGFSSPLTQNLQLGSLAIAQAKSSIK